MKKISVYKDYDNLQYRNFVNIDDLKSLINESIEDFKKELEQKYTGVEFHHFEFGYDYDSGSGGGDSDNYRPTLCIYFDRDETKVEQARREEYEEECRKRKELEIIQQNEMKKKLADAEHQAFLRLKQKYEPQ